MHDKGSIVTWLIDLPQVFLSRDELLVIPNAYLVVELACTGTCTYEFHVVYERVELLDPLISESTEMFSSRVVRDSIQEYHNIMV